MSALDVIHGEYVAISVQGAAYEECINAAMARWMSFLDHGQPLVRTHDEAELGAWYVAGTYGSVSPGGTLMELTVAFRRRDV